MRSFLDTFPFDSIDKNMIEILNYVILLFMSERI